MCVSGEVKVRGKGRRTAMKSMSVGDRNGNVVAPSVSVVRVAYTSPYVGGGPGVAHAERLPADVGVLLAAAAGERELEEALLV